MKYPVLIDGEDGAYGVVFPDLPGCVAMGTTIDEALANAEEAVRDWVESMESHEQPIPSPSNPGTVEVEPGSTLKSVSLTRTVPSASR
ncbi:MAG: type II toxin-antitoxin system HicB family antitoxin [Dehalococcoidia bacterium]|nr:type II toxin-antitoxin system HicB family antitoxin [Dehalococcoidia bacterium]